MAKDRYKFGSGLDGARHIYAPVYWRQPMEAGQWGERLVMTPASGHIALVRDLAACLGEPLGLVYKARLGRPGWHYGPIISREQLHDFLDRFGEFLSTDARHELWICNTQTDDKVIYDDHDWVYAYGDIDAMERTAIAHGLTPGMPEMPVPHSHHFHREFDAVQDELLAMWEWTTYPLKPEHDN